MNRSILIVSGCARSGTTSLATLLNAHPQIALGLERYYRLCRDGRLKPRHFTEERFFSPEAGDSWYDDLDRFAGHYATVRRKFATARIRGDKVPLIHDGFARLVRGIPSAWHLWIFRDPVAVARSYQKRLEIGRDWAPSWDWRMAVTHWNAMVDTARRHLADCRLLLLSFEQLVAEDRLPPPLLKALNLEEDVEARLTALSPADRPTSLGTFPEDARAAVESLADYEGLRRLFDAARAGRSPWLAEAPQSLSEAVGSSLTATGRWPE